jgi:DNA-binding beta-propeller fold protein YncE
MSASASPRFPRTASLLSSLVALSLLAGCAQSLSSPNAVPTPLSTTPAAPLPAATAAPAVAYNATTNTYYVANGFTGNVSVIGGASNTITTNIPVGPAGKDLYSIAVNPTTNMVYVTSYLTGTLTVINGATNAISTTIPTAAPQPVAIAVNYTTDVVYVLGESNQQNLIVYNGATNQMVTGLQIPGTTFGLAVNSKTNTVFVTNVGTANIVTPMNPMLHPVSAPWLTVIDGASNTVTANVQQQNGITAVAVNETTGNVYAVEPEENALVLNTLMAPTTSTSTTSTSSPQWTLASTIIVGNAPNTVAVNPTTNMIYVGNTVNPSLSVINGATNTLSTPPSIPLPAAPTSLAVNATGNFVYAATTTSVDVVNAATNTVATTVPLPGAATSSTSNTSNPTT